ncbi:MAG: histidinol-phosphate transaminase [Clostridia bacterium]|nr:histidinol-phosphate transaminase [Clostridia bacterium]
MTIKHRKIINELSPYIPGKPIEEVKNELGLERVIKLASNENAIGCSPKAKQAISDTLDELALYPDGNCAQLREKISQKYNIEHDQILCGAGSDELIGIIAQTFIDKGDQVLMPYPSFPRYVSATKIMEGDPVELPLKNYTLDLESFARSITKKTKLIWLCNPNNPTGTMYSEQQQLDLLNNIPKDVLVVLDEAYAEYVTDQNYPNSIDLLEKFDNIIILKTFSKAYGLASLRAGYALSSPDIIDYLNRVRGPFNVNRLAHNAATAALDDTDFLQTVININEQGKKYLYQEFERLGLEYIPSQTNFIMVNVKMHSKIFFQECLKNGIIVRSGDIYGMDDWIRLTIGTAEQNEYFIECAQRILNI